LKREKTQFLIILIILCLVTSCSTTNQINQISSEKNLPKNSKEQINYFNSDKSNIIGLSSEATGQNGPNRDGNGTIPESQFAAKTASGETTEVPWENDEKFKSAQIKNDVPVLMAAYRTVLRDPLPGEENNVHHGARILAGTVVEPGEVFSQNKKIGPYTQYRGFQKGPTYIGSKLSTTIGGGVCKIASTLYNATVLGSLPVIERHFHNMPVPYVPYGQDATVAYGAKDFKFKNNTSFPILIWAQGVDNILYIGFYGKVKPPRVQWHHEMLKVHKASKVYRINSNLPKGSEKIILEGMDGGVVKSWVTIENPDGTISTKQLGISYYNPMSYIIEKSK
jgi:vancomycin resistance protein VanW